jgi:hypothetical protein
MTITIEIVYFLFADIAKHDFVVTLITHHLYSFPSSCTFSIGTPDTDYDAPYQQHNVQFPLDIFKNE